MAVYIKSHGLIYKDQDQLKELGFHRNRDMIRNIAAPSDCESNYSAWHTPVPYIFGGVGAMIALLAFAVFILACSNWKKSRGSSAENIFRSSDIRESNFGLNGQNNETVKNTITSCPNDGDKVVVIMAGDKNPSFMATPSCVSAI